VGGSLLAQESLGSLLTDALSSPVGIAMQVAMLAAVVGLVRVDWARRLSRRAERGQAATPKIGRGVRAPR
jgi:hypothetical protein